MRLPRIPDQIRAAMAVLITKSLNNLSRTIGGGMVCNNDMITKRCNVAQDLVEEYILIPDKDYPNYLCTLHNCQVRAVTIS
jgi:hypothetical protein